MDITYLLNSGFLVRDEKTLLVFDDYEDPAGIVDAAYDKADFDRLYIFATHAHFDHFSTHVRAYAPKTTRYIFSSDIKHTKRVKIFPTNKITYMKRYTEWEDDAIHVWSYDSTDVGVCFRVQLPSGKRVFHAGDFNWWHWIGDTPAKAWTRKLRSSPLTGGSALHRKGAHWNSRRAPTSRVSWQCTASIIPCGRLRANSKRLIAFRHGRRLSPANTAPLLKDNSRRINLHG